MRCTKVLSVMVLSLLLIACGQSNSGLITGTLERDRVTLTAPASEVITALPVKEGVPITTGQVLVQLNNTKQSATLKKVIAVEQEAKITLEKLLNGERDEDIQAARANVEQAKANLAEQERQVTRLTNLVGRGLSTQADLDNAVSQKEVYAAVLDASQQNLNKLIKGNRREDIEYAQAVLEAASADVALAQQELDELTIRATRDGVLDSLPFNQGERVSENSIVAIIQASTSPYVAAYIPEPHKAQFTTGKQVTVYVDGVETPFTGTVRWISIEPAFTPYSNMSEEDRSRLVYLTEIVLPEEATSLPAGIPAQIKVD